MKKVVNSLLAVAVASASGSLLAAGFALNEQSVSAMGTSFAGRSSSANDATTVYGNPAGMALLKGEQASVGAAVILAKTRIDDTSATAPMGGALAGSNDGDMVPFTGVPMGFYVNPLNEQWTFGLGFYVPYGMITEYEKGFQGRFFGDYSEVNVVTLQPTLSYRVNDYLSLGFGPTFNRVEGRLETAALVDNGRIVIEGDDTAVGFNAGLLLELSERTRLGVTYHSMVDYRLEGKTSVSGIPAPVNGDYQTTLDLRTPEMIDSSITHQLNDRWTVYAGAAWTRWSRLQTIKPVSAFPVALEEKQHWNNSWSYATGVSYALSKELTLRSGIAFDQSPTNNHERSPRIPSGDRVAISFGLGWTLSEQMSLDLAYSYLREEDTDIHLEKPRKGSYSAVYKNSAHGLGAQLNYFF
ncbi:Long-chain fatty acid transport protein [Pseudomonas fluvialis]|uniref:Aromatic hydrocarbon degradation protein n=1 Tax=Pseudomonas fluvialis TaxID=1793966 RepID=A0ABQ2AR42_9PSED|nr:outer membrane protein transport protein [Pseudomonas fluvialis]OXM40369.1 Long-chain fatty acid transport protein [Pseudomonas fluvialis]GGH95945.1 aromatic hydrocarbon degradation protein [Pseudomonas fluvialis]